MHEERDPIFNCIWTTLIATTKDTHLCDNVYKTAPEKMLVKVTAEQNIWLLKMAKQTALKMKNDLENEQEKFLA